MNVLGICADPGIPLDGAKGASVHLIAVWNALARAGCHLHGVAPWRGEALPRCAPGLTLHPVSSSPGDLQGEASRIARRLPADVILERLALGGTAGSDVARTRTLPRIVEVNAPLDEEAARFRAAPDRTQMKALSTSLNEADGAYVVSSALVAWARGHGARDVRIVPNGVDLRAFSGAREPRRPGPVRAIFVGSFKPWHGVELLVDAVADAIEGGAPIELELVGEGPGRAAAEHRAVERRIGDRVRFTGAIAHDAVPSRLLAADIAVAPAPRDVATYFSPLKLYEYAAAGCAIVAAGFGQVTERFRDGEDACLVTAGDRAGLADALRGLATDAPRRERLGAAARRTAATLDWSHVAETLVRWMETLVHERTRA
jgi:starch synthase